jgi:hypothetical protein
MYYVLFSEKKGIVSPYSINLLISITEAKCVYCAVRTESVDTIQVY